MNKLKHLISKERVLCIFVAFVLSCCGIFMLFNTNKMDEDAQRAYELIDMNMNVFKYPETVNVIAADYRHSEINGYSFECLVAIVEAENDLGQKVQALMLFTEDGCVLAGDYLTDAAYEEAEQYALNGTVDVEKINKLL